jgi:hypothetical protein
MHPYKDDRISQGLGGTFQITSAKDIRDLDSLNMNITTPCMDERMPITEQSLNLTMSGLKEHFNLVTDEEYSFNETLIGGEKASFVTVGGPTESVEFLKAHTITEMNHNNNTYVFKL